MAETMEIPIDVQDLVTSPDHKTVVLPTEKFNALLEYVEQLEDTLKLTEFDLARDQKFSQLLLSFLDKAIGIMPYLQQRDFWSTTTVIRQVFDDLTTEVAEGVKNGIVTGEQEKILREKVLSLVESTGNNDESKAESGGS
jgi:hypothetical protein